MVSLKELESRSIFVIRETMARFKKPCVLWSTGKDSTAMLGLIRDAFGSIPFPVIHIDTGFKFPEMYSFRDNLAKEWKLDLKIAKSPFLGKMSSKTHSKLDCCTILKTDALKNCITKNGFDSVIVSIRRDEHGIRGYERYMSPRDHDFKWNIVKEKAGEKQGSGDSDFEAMQDTELAGWGLFETDFGENCSHVRVHPILHWTEQDVWNYIKEKNIPINPLYFSRNGKRFRSLGCMPCTEPIDSNASTIDEIIEELAETKTKERDGRAQDKEEAYAMQKLRSLGYM